MDQQTPGGADPSRDPSRKLLHNLRGCANAIYLNAAALAQSLDGPECWEFIDRLKEEVAELEVLMAQLGRPRAATPPERGAEAA